jgi:membrane fusion protein (multidrug efflux system)
VAVSASNHAQAQARIDQARAALDNAVIQLQRARIYAPVDGRISKKNVNVGGLVQPGAALLAIVQQGPMWVVANYKETQLARVRPGLPARVTVDALGGVTLRGTVASISPATGATFALLPPENASGNFTRIVQRIPLKIVLDPRQEGVARLRGGMSVTATVELR